MSSGKDSSCIYGRFWYEGKSWAAHRWAAKFIHGLDIEQPGSQVDHCCEPRPNSLCVQHVQVVSSIVNLALRWSRYWQYWCGDYEDEMEEEAAKADPPASDGVPFHLPPAWLRPHLDYGNKGTDDDCPF